MVRRVMDSFSFIAPGHPFHADVLRFKTRFESLPQLSALLVEMQGLGEPQVRTMLRGRYLPAKGWEFRGLSLSFQLWTQLPARVFHAVSLFYSTKTGGLRYYVFPHDPHLPLIPSRSGENRADVLRYIPRRRSTFRTMQSNGVAVIGKCVRTPEITEFSGRLTQVYLAVSRSAATFSVPAAIHRDAGAFYQQLLPGRELTGILDQDNFPALFHTVGTIHRDLHGLAIADAAIWDFEQFLREVQLAIRWISFFRPDRQAFLEQAGQLLWRQTPRVDLRQYVFCHGDFSCSQILREGDHWSIVDFDCCLRADPCWEVAKLMAFLQYDLSLFGAPDQSGRLDRACEAYLDGYQERAKEPLNRKRLLWYRICFEICYVARLFKRDRFQAAAFDRTIETIGKLAGSFRKESEDTF